MIYVIIYFSIIILHSLVRLYWYPLYFNLLPREKVERHYLTWDECFTYNHSVIIFENGSNLKLREFIHYRIDILYLGLFRALFRKLNFERKLKKLNRDIRDLNAMNPSKFYKCKKHGKINI